jgi:hypothetical protein
MDETAFRAFLENQQSTFAEFESLMEAPKTGVTISPNLLRKAPPTSLDFSNDKPMQTRFDDACRCLAEAYIQCDDGQRAVIRKLMRGLPVVSASMGISPEQIQTKIDGARFRLALVFESIKDLRPDEKEAARRLERLREAAMNAGVEPNPFLQEVAWMSNDECHSGRKSMRERLLFLMVPEDQCRCPRCHRWYARNLEKCPHCAALNPAFVSGSRPYYGEGGHTAAEYGEVEVVHTLSTYKLIGYAALCLVALAAMVMTSLQIAFTHYEGYHRTRGAWSAKAIIAILACIVWGFRKQAVKMANFFVRPPPSEIGCSQVFVTIVAMILACYAVYTVLSLFTQELGW